MPGTKLVRQPIMTQGRPSGGWGFTTDVSGSTYHSIWSLDTSGFDAVRLVYAQDAQDHSVVSACIAATTRPNDYFNPVNEHGYPAPWIPVTFNNRGEPVDWEHQPMGHVICTDVPIYSQVLNRPPVIEDVVNLIGYTFSDWVPISSFNRNDGGRWPLLMHRTYVEGVPRPGVIGGGALNAWAWAGWYGDRIQAAWSAQGDYVTNPGQFPPGDDNGKFMPLAVQYYSRSKGYTIMNLGDSIAGGVGAAGVSFALRTALNTSTPDVPVTCFMVPWGTIPGVGPLAYFQASNAVFDGIKPAIVIPQLWSRNWGCTQENLDRGFQAAVELGTRAMKYGGQPIYIAPVPCPDTYDEFAEALRNSATSRVTQLGAGGYMIYDPNPTTELGTGEVPNAYQPWASDDQCHPNDAGHNWIANRLRQILQSGLDEESKVEFKNFNGGRAEHARNIDLREAAEKNAPAVANSPPRASLFRRLFRLA